jgi:cell division protease FtsH
VGFVYYGEDENKPNFFEMGGGREYSEETARAIDEEVKKLIDQLQEEARQLLQANRDRVDALAKALMKYETLDAGDVDRIMRGDNLTKPTVSDLLEQENRRDTIIAPPTEPTQPDVRPGLGGGPLPAAG